MALKDSIKKRVLRLVADKGAYQLLFWVAMLLVYSVVESLFTHMGLFYTISNNVVRLIILGVAVYYNIYFLIPRYLAGKKFFGYLGFLFLVVFIVSPVEAFLIYMKSGDVPNMQAAVLGSLNWSFVTNFFILGTSTVVKITLDWYKNNQEKQELETQNMQSELRFLKSQINPHFLFNTLNSLYALTLKKSDQAPDIVLRLSEMMRYMLYECNEKSVPLSKEVHYIKNYLELERIRQGGHMDILMDVSGSISDQKIAPLMFIPFIENCFKHGAGNHLSKGFVHIRLSVVGDHVDLLIENSKAEAMPRHDRSRSGGIGLVNVRRRLDLLYPNRYKLGINDNPKTYAVNLNLKLLDT